MVILAWGIKSHFGEATVSSLSIILMCHRQNAKYD